MVKEFKVTDKDKQLVSITGIERLISPEGRAAEPVSQTLYWRIIGKLMFTSNTVRPDIATATSILSQFNMDPRRIHLDKAYGVLSYLKRTQDWCLTYGKADPRVDMFINGYTDADWENDPDRKSKTGYAFYLGNSLIEWRSTKKKTIATSTTEAELMAATEAAKEAIYLKDLLAEMGFKQPSVLLREDNTGVLSNMRDGQFHARTKHIDIKHFYVKECVANKKISLVFVPSKENTADLFIKSLPFPLFNKFRANLRMLVLS